MRRVTLYLIVVLLARPPLYAQPVQQMLSLEEAVCRAIETNPAIQAARYQEMSADHMRRAASGLRFPQVALTGNYTILDRDISVDANPLKVPLQNAATELIGTGVQANVISPDVADVLKGGVGALTESSWSLSLQHRNFGFLGGEIVIPIFTGGRINAAVKSSQLVSDVTRQRGLQTQNTIISQVVERYFSLALFTEVINVRRMALAGVDSHLKDAVALEAAGIIARSERIYVEYRRAQAEGELQAAILQHQTINEALRSSIMGEADLYMATTPMFILKELPSVGYFMELATQDNPLLVEASLGQSIAAEEVRLQRSEYFPQIAVVAGGRMYDYRLSSMIPRWTIGVNVSLKIFDGLGREHRHAAAKDNLRYAESRYRQAHDEVVLLVESLYNELINHQSRIASLSSSISFAEAYLIDKRVAFSEGVASATDLIDAELNLAKARVERLEAVCAYDIALAGLLEAVGQSDKFVDYAVGEQSQQVVFNENE